MTGRSSSKQPDTLLECCNLVPPNAQFEPLSLSVGPGEWVCFSGPSGVGKTCLLFVLAGLQSPIRGTIRLDRDTVHLVPQSLLLCSQLDVLDNVLLGQWIKADVASPAKCRSLLSQFGLRERLDFLPYQLSVGEKQRVCLARGLATDAPVLLIDEPTNSLDSDCVSILAKLFREVVQNGRTLLVVSNDPRLTPFADRLVYLDFSKNPAHQLRAGISLPSARIWERWLPGDRQERQ
jgi:putative ABC transport system ATP-binding protein